MTAVKSLCTQGLLLDQGRISYYGEIAQTVREYIRGDNQSGSLEWSIRGNEKLINDTAYYTAVQIVSPENEENIITTNDSVEIRLKARVCTTGNYFFECHLLSVSDEIIFISTSTAVDIRVGEYEVIVTIPGNLLNDGTHKINLSIVKDHKYVIHRLKDFIFFEIFDGVREIEWHGKWDGFVRPKLKWEIKHGEEH